MTKIPVLFISHGSPLSAIENDSYTGALEKFGKKIRKPKAIVAVSAHWEAGQPVRVTTSERPAIIYDFGGFSDELYRIEYPAPGSPEISEKVIAFLNLAGIESKPDLKRGFDHGVWVPFGDKEARVDEWAAQFDQWFSSRIEQHDVQALVDYRRAAPKPFLSVPTTEHFDPIFFALGAAPEEKATLIHEGFHYGNLSTRSFTLG